MIPAAETIAGIRPGTSNTYTDALAVRQIARLPDFRDPRFFDPDHDDGCTEVSRPTSYGSQRYPSVTLPPRRPHHGQLVLNSQAHG